MPKDIIVNNLVGLSYNSTGWSDIKADFLYTILLSHAIMFCAVQEHFLLANNLYKINQSLPDFDYFGLPAFKSNAVIHGGRPSGGLAILFPKKFSRYITHVTCPNSDRVHAIKLCLPNSSYMIINCYFPVDRRNQDNDILLTVLQDINTLLTSVKIHAKL